MTETVTGVTQQHLQWFAEQFDRLTDNIETFIRGKRDVVRLALVSMLSEGHLLLDDVPGLGKTSLAQAIANSVSGTMGRIQFTPDLLPSDVSGGMIWNAKNEEFVFRHGPVFNTIVIADEINRASPKTQSALLEVMEERQVTMDGQTFHTPRPFVVFATQNPIEYAGTYPLPEAQLDRFMMCTGIGYPDAKHEVEIVKARAEGRAATDVQPVMDLEAVKQMMLIARGVSIDDILVEYAIGLARYTRTMPELRLGISPRGPISLVRAAKVYAASQGSMFVTTDYLKFLAPYVFVHRMLRTSDAELQGLTPEGLIRQVLNRVEVPSQPAARG